MRKSVVVLIAACIVFVLFGQSRAQGEFFMRFEREDNFITLSCQNGADRTSVPNAQFFRNNLRVDNGRQDGILTFHIDRAREGNYTCGKNRSVQSNFESIIAFPNTEVDRIPPRQHHLEGEHVLLDCAISPGALLQQYYVTWSISGRVIYRTSPGSSPEILDDRYVLVPSNLSLIINNVQLSDASENYLCVLSVADPNSANLRDYDVLRNINISLVVLAHPAITTPPHSRIVTEGNETMFSCSATGSPLPVISWLHNSKPVTSGNSRYTVRVPVPGSVNSTVTTSTLTLSSVVSLDSGSVTCIASASSDADIGNRELESDRQSAQLSVLGSFQDIEIRITVDRDVIFDIDLPIKLADPVRLYLEYHNVDNKKMDTKTTSAMYTNLSNIRHIEFDSDVNFERFEVSVALVSVTNVRGPLIAAGRYDKSQPTDQRLEMSVIITIGVVPAILASVVAILIVVLCAVKKKWLLDYKLKQLVISNTGDYIKHLQAQIENETRPEILKELIKLMTIASERFLNPDGSVTPPVVAPTAVTALDSPTVVSNKGGSKSDDYINLQLPKRPSITLNGSNEIDAGIELRKVEEGARAERRQKVFFQSHVSVEETRRETNDREPQSTQLDQLTNLFAAFLSKAVHDSLLNASERHPRLADKVEKEVRCAVFQRQQSITSSATSYTEGNLSCTGCYVRSVSDNGKTTTVQVERQCSVERRNTMV